MSRRLRPLNTLNPSLDRPDYSTRSGPVSSTPSFQSPERIVFRLSEIRTDVSSTPTRPPRLDQPLPPSRSMYRKSRLVKAGRIVMVVHQSHLVPCPSFEPCHTYSHVRTNARHFELYPLPRLRSETSFEVDVDPLSGQNTNTKPEYWWS